MFEVTIQTYVLRTRRTLGGSVATHKFKMKPACNHVLASTKTDDYSLVMRLNRTFNYFGFLHNKLRQMCLYKIRCQVNRFVSTGLILKYTH
jgi:hypothetical protein